MSKPVRNERLYTWMQMMILSDKTTFFLKKSALKECDGFLSKLGFENRELNDENRQKLKEMAKDYIEMSLDSPEYAKQLLGLKRATKEEAIRRMTLDIQRGAVDYLLKFNKLAESEILLTIFKSAFIEVVQAGSDYWKERFGE